jgi:hypothetical protein
MSEDENLAVVRRTIESFTNDVETWLVAAAQRLERATESRAA